MALEGVDYAFPPRPRASELARLGKKFAVRYGGPGTRDKWLDPTEAQALAAAGLSIVANAEGSAGGLRLGFSEGARWARTADAWFRSCGMPPDRPIYFSVDFDTTSGDWDELDAAMDGAASVISRERVGVYGEYSIINHFVGNRKAVWYWETYAWSGGQWHPASHLQQYHNGVTIDGADCDLNRAMQSDFGQWQPGGSVITSDNDAQHEIWRVKTMSYLDDKVQGGPEVGKTLPFVPAFKQLASDVAALKARPPVQAAPVDPAALKAVLLDPDVLAAIAKAVTNEIGS
jgi:Rv2525c-like, glycoside hydrolase-like domain